MLPQRLRATSTVDPAWGNYVECDEERAHRPGRPASQLSGCGAVRFGSRRRRLRPRGGSGPQSCGRLVLPDVALLEPAVTALDLACPAGAEPLEYGAARALPAEATFRGRVEHRNSQYALYATACMRGGLQPDLLSEAGWWQTPLWQYAVYAVVIYSRAAAERLVVPVEEIARRIAAQHGLELIA
jgi:hypothetical protein